MLNRIWIRAMLDRIKIRSMWTVYGSGPCWTVYGSGPCWAVYGLDFENEPESNPALGIESLIFVNINILNFFPLCFITDTRLGFYLFIVVTYMMDKKLLVFT